MPIRRAVLGMLGLAGMVLVGASHPRATSVEASVAAARPTAVSYQQSIPAAADSTVSPQRAMLNRYCVTCHNQRLRTAQLALDTAQVDDVPMTLLVDTGASFVTLTMADAAGIGVDVGALEFATPIRTANGVIRAARITLDRLAVGAIERHDLAALVAPPDSLDQSLLGMSFLNTLDGYGISGDRLVLTD